MQHFSTSSIVFSQAAFDVGFSSPSLITKNINIFLDFLWWHCLMISYLLSFKISSQLSNNENRFFLVKIAVTKQSKAQVPTNAMANDSIFSWAPSVSRKRKTHSRVTAKEDGTRMFRVPRLNCSSFELRPIELKPVRTCWRNCIILFNWIQIVQMIKVFNFKTMSNSASIFIDFISD